jgi:hypothetical protein
MRRFVPGLQPRSFRAFPNAARRALVSPSASKPFAKTPTIRVCWLCCARAASGHPIVVPAESKMNSRRCIRRPSGRAMQPTICFEPASIVHHSKRCALMSHKGQKRHSGCSGDVSYAPIASAKADIEAWRQPVRVRFCGQGSRKRGLLEHAHGRLCRVCYDPSARLNAAC